MYDKLLDNAIMNLSNVPIQNLYNRFQDQKLRFTGMGLQSFHGVFVIYIYIYVYGFSIVLDQYIETVTRLGIE